MAYAWNDHAAKEGDPRSFIEQRAGDAAASERKAEGSYGERLRWQAGEGNVAVMPLPAKSCFETPLPFYCQS